VRAPTDGVIKTKIAELGETMAAGSPIVVLLDTSQAWLRVYVPENRYGLIRIGQKAEVTVDSFPGRAFQGSVVEIASEPEFTPKNVQTQEERVKLVYGVKILLDNAEGRLKPGMPADAVIRVKD
jgi:HlyD family secretion protein